MARVKYIYKIRNFMTKTNTNDKKYDVTGRNGRKKSQEICDKSKY